MRSWCFCLVDLDPADEEQQRRSNLDKNTADRTETEQMGNRVDDFVGPDMP